MYNIMGDEITELSTGNKKSTRKWHSESADTAKALNLSFAKQTNRQTKNFGHREVRTFDPRVFSTMLLPTEP